MRNLKLFYQRLQTWYRKESGKGVGLFEIMFHRLPWILAVKAYRQTAAIANDRLIEKAYNQQRFKVERWKGLKLYFLVFCYLFNFNTDYEAVPGH